METIVKVEFWGVISQNGGFGGSNAAAFLLLLCLRVIKKEFRERERVVLFSCCLIFVRFFLTHYALFHFFHFFWLLTRQTKTRTRTTHLTKTR
jgi:hypothetical protein